jgi:hypothetical protein
MHRPLYVPGEFRKTIRERAQREPRFRRALLREAIELMLSGDEKTGRAILRNYINAAVDIAVPEPEVGRFLSGHLPHFLPHTCARCCILCVP